MDLTSTILLLRVLFADTTSHLCFKAASFPPAQLDGFAYWLTLVASPFVWLGIGLFFLDLFLWVGFLSRVPLGQGVMAGSITIVGVMLGGRALFGERITSLRLSAVSLITVGVALVGWGQQ